jgi:maltokinase
VLSELVLGAHDGFELACEYARDNHEFGHLAEDLGHTTAQMHRALREALPTVSEAVQGVYRPDDGAHAATLRTVVRTLRERAGAAVDATPLLASRAEGIEAVIAAVDGVDRLPPLQRVHGDFHLGQVLRSEVRGWAVLDFEGEPQAPAHERTRPDLALRDLAGMLRSIDYAAAVGGAHSPGWAKRAREGLVRGYRSEAESGSTGLDQSAADVLLRALELDKALYEVVYESRNRPAWLQIPLEAVDRLLSAHG